MIIQKKKKKKGFKGELIKKAGRPLQSFLWLYIFLGFVVLERLQICPTAESAADEPKAQSSSAPNPVPPHLIQAVLLSPQAFAPELVMGSAPQKTWTLLLCKPQAPSFIPTPYAAKQKNQASGGFV